MDIEQARQLSRMHCREFPEATTEWMRCQIGVWGLKLVNTGRYKEKPEKVFSVRAFGETWEEAIDMLERSKKPS